MGNSNGSRSLSLKSLPVDVIGRPEMQKYNIKIGDKINSYFVNAKFPEGWTHEICGEYWVKYIDPHGYNRFSCFAKICDYEKVTYTVFNSDETVQRFYDMKIKTEQELKIQTEQMTDLIRELFVPEWSPIHKYIIYYFRDGSYSANSYMAGYPRDERFMDCIIELSGHKFIGFVDDLSKLKVFGNALKVNITYANVQTDGFSHLVVRELPDGLENLHKFEIQHMFKEKPKYSGHKKTSNDVYITKKPLYEILH